MLIRHFEETLTGCRKHLTFWRNRIMPTNKREVDRESAKYGGYIYAVPYEVRSHHKVHYTEEAKQYWLGKIKSVEQKIEMLTKR